VKGKLPRADIRLSAGLARVLQVKRGDAMDSRIHRTFPSRGPSRFDWLMLAFSVLTIAWIVLAH
jgi:hypothetical protein